MSRNASVGAMSTAAAAAWMMVAVAVVASVAGGWFLVVQRTRDDDDDEHDQVPIDSSPLPGTTIPRNITLDAVLNDKDSEPTKKRILSRGTITIVHASVTGTCASLAQILFEGITSLVTASSSIAVTIQIGKVEEWDWWDELLNNDGDNDTTAGKIASQTLPPPMVLFVLPTHSGGTWSTSATALQSALQDMQHDWRIEKQHLRPTELHVAAFGMGSSAYDKATMGQPAREAYHQLRSLGAKTLGLVGVGDDSVGDYKQDAFVPWMEDIVQRVEVFVAPPKMSTSSACGCGTAPSEEGCCQSNHEEKKIMENEEEEDHFDDSDEEEQGEPDVMDLEDMGDSMMASGEEKSREPREMVTPSQAAALKKEGYKLIGTHSAVKLCRWTKHQLRGRGGCYKHTFYGITSYQCMEATPSLACANKCVFCWRHHKNPVGKEWRWKTDDPYFIVDEAVKTHVSMIREAKGIPGVRMDRWEEALTVRHCALSLVGEPIMYPRIGELLGDLHSRKISTFLVTNGQHPQAIETLRPITQLYVSVDAPTPESLIAIDRPLFDDAWDRLKQSLSSLKAKGQRTVARLTVVKGWNSDEVEGYAKLIALGHVSLVEVKGVTFCGKSDASNLNMSNSPWHHEVVSLTRKLQEELGKLHDQATEDAPPEYGLACEHKHSCSVLLARVDQFAEDDPVTGERRWKTWINYEKFHELAARYAQDSSFKFSVEDYTEETPPWALFGAEEEGFDPTDTRHRKKKKHPKYTKFDERGIPTHDDNNVALSAEEREPLTRLMEDRMKEIGAGSTVTELKGGAKEVQDASLMFRGLVVVK